MDIRRSPLASKRRLAPMSNASTRLKSWRRSRLREERGERPAPKLGGVPQSHDLRSLAVRAEGNAAIRAGVRDGVPAIGPGLWAYNAYHPSPFSWTDGARKRRVFEDAREPELFRQANPASLAAPRVTRGRSCREA